MPNYNAIVGKDVHKINLSADNLEEARKKVKEQLQDGEEIFELSESTGSIESGT